MGLIVTCTLRHERILIFENTDLQGETVEPLSQLQIGIDVVAARKIESVIRAP